MAYGEKEESVFLGRDFAQRHQDYSERTAVAIDEEISRIVAEQHQVAHNVLMEHRSQLDSLAQALLERETLDSEEIQAVIEGGRCPSAPRSSSLRGPTKRRRRRKSAAPRASSARPNPPRRLIRPGG